MKRSKADAQKTRKEIVKAAADELRRKGVAHANVSEVMASVGMTHGGFYRHFESRDQLLEEGLQLAVKASREILGERLAAGGVERAINEYLNTSHRDADVPRCPYAGLGAELARDPKLKTEASNGIADQIQTLADHLGGGDEASDRAALILSTMLGALTLARLVDDLNTSDRILELGRRQALGLAETGVRILAS
jgi:TetR/AcrR family transcriptional repressor of nem operon